MGLASQCGFIHFSWGRCHQPASPFYCPFHNYWLFVVDTVGPDPYYHEKIVKGQVEPVDNYLTPREISATMVGRGHGDGRRLDHFAIDEPIDWPGP